MKGHTFMHPLFLLAGLTFILIIAFLVWNLISTKRHRFGKNPTGIGGAHDPLAGATNDLRGPDEMRASLDRAADTPSIQQTYAKSGTASADAVTPEPARTQTGNRASFRG